MIGRFYRGGKSAVEIADISVYSGRNIYSHYPVIKVRLDLGEYADRTSAQLPLFADRLLSVLLLCGSITARAAVRADWPSG